MAGKAACIRLTQTRYHILQALANSRSLGSAVATRARVILLGFEKKTNQEVARQASLGRQAVGQWRRRWRDSYEALLALQFSQSAAAFRRSLVAVLSDAPRSGTPGTFRAEQVAGMVAVACEPPSRSGLPVTHWTGRELAAECRQRGIVESISGSHVNYLLRQVDLQPHRSRYWCTTTEQDPEQFAREVQHVCQTYLEAPPRYQQDRTHTVCVDEMTGVQALERRAPAKPPRPGQVAKIEFNYTRHGTWCVTANWHVVQGQLLATTIAPTRDNEDFARHVERLVATDSQAPWVIVLDNLNTHCGAPLVRSVAKLLGIDPATLGEVKKRGVLKSKKTRRAFLGDRAHRIRFVYTPKHSSWLNQIEIIFGVISRRVLRGGSFTSTADLKDRLLRFIDYFNQTFAKPMNWTYTGRPTRNAPTARPRTWREKRQLAHLSEKLALVNEDF